MEKHSSQHLLQTLSKKSKNSDSFISSFFIDQMPYWREHRYSLTLESINNSLLKSGYSSEFIRNHLKRASNLLQEKTLLAFELLPSSTKQSEVDRYLAFIRTLREALGTKEYAKGYQNLLKGHETRTPDELCTFLCRRSRLHFSQRSPFMIFAVH